ncbi:MAG: hypothetical protein ABL921_29565 [Pirellula sp.]
MLDHLFKAISNSFSTSGPPAIRPSLGPQWTAKDAVQEVREIAELHRVLVDNQLRTILTSFRNTAKEATEHIIPLSVAVEVIRRVLSLEPHDCQILAASALMQGNIVELGTGEGKTIVAALASICHAFHGRSTHVMTVNSYLALRDYHEMKPAYDLLGVTVGLIDSKFPLDQKRHAYRSEVVYGPGYEFGFDYLRDCLTVGATKSEGLGKRVQERWGRNVDSKRVSLHSLRIQSKLCVAIVDEADSVMLDDASTPLILAAENPNAISAQDLYRNAMEVAQRLTRGEDYTIDERARTLQLTSQSTQRINNSPSVSTDGLTCSWPAYVERALHAMHLLTRDVDYIVQSNRVMLIDHSTGRVLPDRTLRAGMHQAVEAKEGVAITTETHALATITRQRFFGVYEQLSGLTGTAAEGAPEFHDVYKLNVVSIAPNQPSCLKWLPPQLCLDRASHEEAIVQSIATCRNRGQPIMIGTSSIQSSERLALLLRRHSIPFALLSGKQDADEAAVVGNAAQYGAVTIVTNIAGRGTDIRLGPKVSEQGGLHILSTEMSESVRIERQLMGRAGRQGDPGSFQIILALDDPLLKRHAPEWVQKQSREMQRSGMIHQAWFEDIRTIQRTLEASRRKDRQRMFERDDMHRTLARALS